MYLIRFNHSLAVNQSLSRPNRLDHYVVLLSAGGADHRGMELKVWVDDVVRVVCGLTLSTSCKDVVIALAQSLGNPRPSAVLQQGTKFPVVSICLFFLKELFNLCHDQNSES